MKKEIEIEEMKWKIKKKCNQLPEPLDIGAGLPGVGTWEPLLLLLSAATLTRPRQ